MEMCARAWRFAQFVRTDQDDGAEYATYGMRMVCIGMRIYMLCGICLYVVR